MPKQSKSRLQPLVALRALRTLIKDPERTEQVFIIIRAMSSDSIERNYARFLRTDRGQFMRRERPDLIECLKDRDALRKMPTGSLGRAYLEFVESQQITADGLVDASTEETSIEDPGLRWFAERMRDMHDLWHVTTGYGRDTFGEACLLAFTYAQTRNRGLGIIAFVGTLKLARELGQGIFSAVWQGYRAGKRARWLPEQAWEQLLHQPLDQVRHQLRVGEPVQYRSVYERLGATPA
ncbi:MAG: Coq4 family protein [Pseudomonadota bacterium]|nr:Coq4 family protein [Pseudomonadota bacterium]